LKSDDRNILKSDTKHVSCYKNKLLLLSIPFFHWSTSSTTAVWSPKEPRPLAHPTPQVARCVQPLFIQLSVRWTFHSIPRFCLLFKLFNHSPSPPSPTLSNLDLNLKIQTVEEMEQARIAICDIYALKCSKWSLLWFVVLTHLNIHED